MYTVIADSSADMDKKFFAENPAVIVPFKLYIGEKEYIDDEKLDVDEFIDTFKTLKVLPKSACPSPNDFLEAIKNAETEVYIVTISSRLSGTYNSAVLAKKMYEEEFSDKKIHIFDSKSATSGETILIRQIHNYKKEGLGFEEVVEKVEEYLSEMRVFFILESLDNLIKNGRISKLKGLIASTFSIIPIMGNDENGEIKLLEKVRTKARAYQRLIEILSEFTIQKSKKMITITHVGNPLKAEQILEAVSKSTKLIEESFIIKCKGLSSLYADKGGIVVAL